jgi:hypothetical protein
VPASDFAAAACEADYETVVIAGTDLSVAD